jgi:hypothetical protein
MERMKNLTLFLTLAATTHAAPPSSFFRALHIVETSGKRGAILGDNGRALGPLQIHRGYHADSRVSGDYARCADFDYSKRVVSAYLQRHAPAAWAVGDVKTLARIHNGGPRGDTKQATVNYGAKVARLTK